MKEAKPARMRMRVSAVLLTLVITACSAAHNGMIPSSAGQPDSVRALAAAPDAATSILKQLTKKSVIGSTVDPSNGDKGPTGLALYPKKSGKIAAGSLVACNYDNKSGAAGKGTTIVALPPKVGSKPTHIAKSADLQGCSALSVDYQNLMWSASASAGLEALVTGSGTISSKVKSPKLPQPFGTVFGATDGPSDPYAVQMVFASDASTGSIVRMGINYGHPGAPTAIITGFKVNKAGAGKILGPSGLSFLRGKEGANTLYVVDGANNVVYAFGSVCGSNAFPITNIFKANSIKVGSTGLTFSGPEAKSACIVYSGSPLASPVGATLLYNGNLVVANTETNTLVELTGTPKAKVLDTVTVDKGAARALSGLVATGKTAAQTSLYFTDANSNNVQALSK